MNGETAKWVIVGLSVAAIIFNTGITYNCIQGLKESVKDIWKEINQVKNMLIQDRQKKE